MPEGEGTPAARLSMYAMGYVYADMHWQHVGSRGKLRVIGAS